MDYVSTMIRKERRLSTKGEVLVKLGDTVKPDTLVARGTVPNPDIHELKLFRSLGVDPEFVKNHLIKKEGETVERDEVLAIARSFFSRQTKMARSPIDGRIEAFSSVTGRMHIRGHPLQLTVHAYLPGKIVELYPDEGAVVETEGVRVEGLFGIGGETFGGLSVAVESGDMALTSHDIKPEYKGKVILGGSVISLDALREARRAGVKGILVGGVDQKDLTYFLGYEIGAGITGSEDVGFSLILLGGFGVNPIPEDVFNQLASYQDRLVCINGSTQIRSRMQRPEIFFPS